jgi:antitoxin CcdA
MSGTVTARVPDELKADMDEYDINVSEIVRDALEAEVRRRRREELIKRGDDLSRRIGDQIETERVVENIREDRESR